MVKDPVCGMEIEKENAAAQQEHEGKTYYFCSGSCHAKFKVAPQAYAQKDAGSKDTGKGKSGCCGCSN